MSKLKSALSERFGEHRVKDLQVGEGEIPLLLIELDIPGQIRVLVTNGLNSYEMPVPEKMKGREFNELYFCIPSYWEMNEPTNPKMNWVFIWIQKMAKFVLEKNTWFGHGHTIPNGPDKLPLSPTMNQTALLLMDPILLEEELAPILIDGKTVHFLAIMPIFSDELDYKQARGTFKFLQKLNLKGVNEKLDDFRTSILKGKWRLFKR